jgi:hypothetical protein
MAETESSPAEVAEPPDPNLITTLADGTKVKMRKPRQRACNEVVKKGKICAGHLKRWYDAAGELAEKTGEGGEIYRCERCQTLYLPNKDEVPRTGTLSF